MRKSTITISEAAVVSTICFGYFIFTSTQAVWDGFPEARFTESGNWMLILIEVVLACVALLYLRSRNFDIGSLYPKPELPGTLIGLGVFAATFLGGAVVMAPFNLSDTLLKVQFSFNGMSLMSTVLVAMVNGTFEEIFLLGVLVRGLRTHGLSIAIGIPLLIRVLYHLYQGPLGAIWVLTVGLMFTLAYLRVQSLWPLVLAHILWDIVPVLAARA